MKCEFCGGSLSLEAEYCPCCGQINKHAQQHIRDMKRYHGEFEDTKKGIYSVARKYSEVAVRFIIIGILAVLIIVMLILNVNVYSIRRSFKQWDAKRHVKEYSEILDGYLEEEQYRDFIVFCEDKYIEGYYEDGEYDEYHPIIRAVSYYLQMKDSLMQLMIADEEQKSMYVDRLCDDMSYFYEVVDRAASPFYYEEVSEETGEVLDALEGTVQAMLCTYCGLTQEEALSLRELSEAKRTVLIEEKFENE